MFRRPLQTLSLALAVGGLVAGPRLLCGQDQRGAVMAVVDSAMRFINTGEVARLSDLMTPEAQVYAASTRSGQPGYVMRTAESQRVAGRRNPIIERGFSADVRITGTIAVVWLPYDLYVDNAWSHCGVDVFTLVLVGEHWRIANLTYSVEQPPACSVHPDGPAPGSRGTPERTAELDPTYTRIFGDDAEDVIVGHMRKDGVLVPHFRWSDTLWRHPEPYQVRTWTRWLHVPFHGQREWVHVGQSVSFPEDAMGYDAWGLQSSSRYRRVENGDGSSWPNARIGFVFSNPLPFAAFTAAPGDGELARRLAPYVKSVLDTARIWQSERRVSGAADSISISVAALGGDTVVVLSAWRRLAFSDPEYPHEGPHRLSFYAVGLLRGARFVPAVSESGSHADDGIGLATARLYALFEHRGRRYAHGVISGWEAEAPLLLEVRGDALVGAPGVEILRP